MNLGTSAFLAFSCRIGAVALLAAFRFYLAIVMGPADQSVYYSFLQLAYLIATVGGMGLGVSAAYHLAHDRQTSRGVAAGTFHLTVVIAAAVSLVSMPLTPVLVPGAGPPVMPLLIAAASLAAALTANGQGVLLGLRRSGWAFLPMGALTVINILVFILLAATGMDALRAGLLAFCVAAGAIALVYYVAGVRAAGEGLHFFGPLLRARLGYGMQNALSAFLSIALFRADFFVVSRTCGSTGAGAYSLAEMISELVWFVPDAVAVVLLPHGASLDDKELRARAPRLSRITLTLSCGLAVAVGAAGLLVLTPLLAAYRASLVPLVVMLPGVCAIASSKVSYTILASRASLTPANMVLGVSVVANGGLTLALAPALGLPGAAIASSVSGIFCAVIMAVLAGRCLGCPALSMIAPGRGDLAFFRDYARETYRRLAKP